RVELKQRVDLQKLNAGDGVDAVAADPLEHRLHHPFVAHVPVVIRILEQVAALADQRIVHAPAVHADAREPHAGRVLERLAHLGPERRAAPVERPVRGDRPVGEGGDLAGLQRAAVPASEDGPAAFCAEIEREVRVAHRFLRQMRRNSTFIGGPTCIWKPSSPPSARFFQSSSTTMLVMLPLRIWMIVLPRARMWTWFQSLVLTTVFSSSALCCGDGGCAAAVAVSMITRAASVRVTRHLPAATRRPIPSARSWPTSAPRR